MSDDQALRMLVREIVRRHLEGRHALAASAVVTEAASHPSHHQFPVSRGADADGPCLVEAAVSCVHCGYCRSWGY